GGFEEHLEGLAVALARLVDAVQAEDFRLYRRDAAAHAELESAARELIEHADLVVEAVGVVPGQAERERAAAQPPRALEDRREQHARRAVDRERRAGGLGDEHAVEARGVGRGGEVQLVRVDLSRRERRRGLDPVEDAEMQLFHVRASQILRLRYSVPDESSQVKRPR